MPKPISKCVTFFAFVGIILISVYEIQSSSCLLKFKNVQELQRSQISCMRSLGLKENALILSSDHLAKSNYQDKCLANCVLGKLNMLNANKTVNTVALTESIKTNVPAESHAKLFEIVKKCSVSTEKTSKELDKNETTKNVCKYAALFLYCFIEEDISANVC